MIFYDVLGVIVILALVTIIHELGHILFFRWGLNKKVSITLETQPLEIHIGKWTDYLNLTNKNKFWLYYCGVMSGFIVLFPARFFVSWAVIGIVTSAYVFGCRSDIENMAKTVTGA